MEIPNIYEGDYRRLVIFPLALFLASLFLIFVYPKLPSGIDLRGGVEITVQTDKQIDQQSLLSELKGIAEVEDVQVEQNSNPVGGYTFRVTLEQNEKLAIAEKELKNFYDSYEKVTNYSYIMVIGNSSTNLSDRDKEVYADALAKYPAEYARMRNSSEYILVLAKMQYNESAKLQDIKDSTEQSYVTAKDNYKQNLIDYLSSKMKIYSYSFKDITPSLSESFIARAQGVIIASSIIVAIAIFLIFRTLVPSLAVISGAINDITIALGFMCLFRVPITLASFAALLMIIGYSLDTDVLLTMRVLKREEDTARKRAYETLKTGLTMNSTAFTSFSILFIVSLISHIPTYYQISAVVLFGIIGDIVATWCLNAVMVLWYAEKLEKERYGKMGKNAKR